jgi:hypothetical protein
MVDAVAASSGHPYELLMRVNFDVTLGVQYLPAERSGSGTVSAYQLYAQCPGRIDKAVINERSELMDGESAATRWWLNDCQDPVAADARLLAERAGYRIGAATAASTNVGSVSTPPVSPAPRIDPAPDFGTTPDLPARRAECVASPRGCYGLALELERTVHLDGGNPNRDETLSTTHRALAEEANRAYARACRAGDVRACHAEADVLLNGRATAEDLPRALTLFEQGCRGGYALSCVQVGELLERGRRASKWVPSSLRVTPDGDAKPVLMSVPDPSRPGVARDVTASVAAYRRACALGEDVECLRAARVALEPGAGAEPERQRAIEDLRKYCAGGQALACELLAQQAAANDGAIAGRTVAEWRQRACRLGERSACGG